MDEVVFIVFLTLLGLGVMFGGVTCGIIALVKIGALRREIRELRRALTQTQEAPPSPRVSETPVLPEQEAAEGTIPTQLRAAEKTLPLPPVPVPSELGMAPRYADWWQDFEKRVGQRWMTWAGCVILFLGAAFFVKHAVENQWIGPTGRVSLGIALGIALIITGHRFMRRGYRALAQGVMGSGLAILYVSVFAAFSLYKLVPQGAAFAVMVLFTATGMALAVMCNAPWTAILATLGGLLTPVLVSTGQDARDALFAYLTVLDLGILGVAFFRRWRALDVLAFLGTMSLYIGWFSEFYTDAALVPALLWLGAFYLVFLVLPFVYHLRRMETAPVERFVMALANATFTFGYAYHMLHDEYRHALGFIALAIAVLNAVMGSLSRARLKTDGRQALGFMGMAVAFLTIAVPIHLKLEGITLAWAIEAPVLLFLGYRYRYFPLRVMSAAVLLVAGIRAFAVSFPDHVSLFVPIFNSTFGTAVAVPVAAAIFAWICQRNISDTTTREDRVIMRVAACASVVAALIVLTAEMNQWFFRAGAAAEAVALYGRYAVGFRVVLWTAGALALLWAGLRLRSLWSRGTGFGVLAVSTVMAFYSLWDYRDEPYWIFLNVRFVTVLFQIAGIFTWAWLIKRFADRCCEAELRFRMVLVGAAMLLLLALVSVEAYNFFYELATNTLDARWISLGAVSVAWGLYAATALTMGFRRRVRWLRYTALGLFGLTVVKLVLLDMAGVKDIYRIIVFFLLGLILIGVAYAYHRIEKILDGQKEVSA